MRKKEKNNFRKLILPLLIVTSTVVMFPVLSFTQSIESAREKFNNKDYNAAEEELTAILESEGENFEAESLLNEIEKARTIEKADILTQKALIEIDNRNFDTAFKYLEEAILLNPENIQSRELYLTINEIVEIEQKSIEEVIEKAETPAQKEEERLVQRVEEPPVQEEEKFPPPKGEELIAQKEDEERIPEELQEDQIARQIKEKEAKPVRRRQDELFVRLSTAYLFANSNYLDYIDSAVSMLGGRLEGRYYFPFLQKKLGFSADYSTYLLKTSGDENINFLVHRITASVRYRTFFFEDEDSRLIVGTRLNYHAFLLQNREDEGVYNFTRVYGPSFGVFLSDPVIYRFYKKDFFKNIGFEGELNYLYVVGKGDTPTSPELYIGTYYDLNRYRFSLGYRRFSIKNENVKESYNNIELAAGYRF